MSVARQSPTGIAQEKRIKRWRRPWKFARIEQGNPDRRDFYDRLNR
jgi:putative endonuclease